MNTVVVSGEYPCLIKEIEALGVRVIPTAANGYLPRKTAFHADMQFLSFPDKTFVLKGSDGLKQELIKQGIKVELTGQPAAEYPRDVLCNGKLVGDKLFCNDKTLDKAILSYCAEINIIPVNQGYTGCSVCAVDGNSVITADRSIAAAAEKNHFEVLLISEGFIELPGYGYGFIGGCSGKISENEMVFTGALSSHPDGARMKRFIGKRNIRVTELNRERLLDIGGIVPVKPV